jgi:hypothetical protein
MIVKDSVTARGRKGLAALSLCIASLLASSAIAQAEDSFGTSIAASDLNTIRGGAEPEEQAPTGPAMSNSNNNISTSESNQETTATNQNNTIGGDAPAGSINISAGSFQDIHGMNNVVMNSAPMSNVQGIMSLNVVLH